MTYEHIDQEQVNDYLHEDKLRNIDMEVSNMEYEEIVAGQVWTIEKEGDSIEGVFKRTVAGQFGNNYVIATEDEELTVFGSTVLNTKMASVDEGSKVRLTYIGEKKSKEGRVYKDFKVEVAK